MHIHINTNHRGNEIYNNNIYYKGIIQDIHDIINKCSICNIKKTKY